jgi:hypothetical protein
MSNFEYRCKKESVEVINQGVIYTIKLRATAEDNDPYWHIEGIKNQFPTLDAAMTSIKSLHTTIMSQSPECGTTRSEASS